MGARMNDGSELKADEPIGAHPETGEDIFVMNGRFGPYVQLGKTPAKGVKRKKEKKKKGEMGQRDESGQKTGKSNVGTGTNSLRRASIPKEKRPDEVTVADAVRYLSLPRILGTHPETGDDITASIGRFGPFIVHEKDFRSLKAPDNPYDITLPCALEILKEEKKTRGGRQAKK